MKRFFNMCFAVLIQKYTCCLVQLILLDTASMLRLIVSEAIAMCINFSEMETNCSIWLHLCLMVILFCLRWLFYSLSTFLWWYTATFSCGCCPRWGIALNVNLLVSFAPFILQDTQERVCNHSHFVNLICMHVMSSFSLLVASSAVNFSIYILSLSFSNFLLWNLIFLIA